MDTLQCPRILISPHGDYPILFKMRVMRHISLHIVTSAPPAPPDRGCNFYLIKYCIQDTTFAFVRHTLSCLNHHSHLMPANNWVLAGTYQQRLKVHNEYYAPTNSAICSLKFKLVRTFLRRAVFYYFLCDTFTKNGFNLWVVIMMLSSGLGLGFFESTSNLRFCINIVKKMKMLHFANDMPRHILLPIPNGTN